MNHAIRPYSHIVLEHSIPIDAVGCGWRNEWKRVVDYYLTSAVLPPEKLDVVDFVKKSKLSDVMTFTVHIKRGYRYQNKTALPIFKSCFGHWLLWQGTDKPKVQIVRFSGIGAN